MLPDGYRHRQTDRQTDRERDTLMWALKMTDMK